jgi:hypothetical protein
MNNYPYAPIFSSSIELHAMAAGVQLIPLPRVDPSVWRERIGKEEEQETTRMEDCEIELASLDVEDRDCELRRRCKWLVLTQSLLRILYIVDEEVTGGGDWNLGWNFGYLGHSFGNMVSFGHSFSETDE